MKVLQDLVALLRSQEYGSTYFVGLFAGVCVGWGRESLRNQAISKIPFSFSAKWRRMELFPLSGFGATLCSISNDGEEGNLTDTGRQVLYVRYR